MAVTLISDTTKTFFTSGSKKYEELKYDVKALTLFAKDNVLIRGTQETKGTDIVVMCNEADVRVYFTNETRAKDISDLEAQGYRKLTTL